MYKYQLAAAVTADAKLLQSCPTLCNSIDGSPPGSTVPGVLQARTLEWVAISFSNAGKWKVKMKSLSRVRPSATPWTAAFQAPPSMGFFSVMELPRWLSGKESACQCKRHRLIPALGRSAGEGNDNPFQYSCLVNSMDRGAWWGYSPWGRKRVGHDSATKQQSLPISAFVETENRF